MSKPVIFKFALSKVDGRLDPIATQPLVQLLRDKFRNSPFPVKALHWLVDFKKSITKDINAGDVYVGLENIDGTTGDYVPTVAKESIGSAAIFERGDILFPKLRPYLNKTYVAEFDGLCSTEFHVLKAHGASAAYITAVLRSDAAVRLTSFLMTGNTLPRLQTADIEQMEIPLPPTHIQDEIVNKLSCSKAEMRALNATAAKFLDKARDELHLALGIPRIDSSSLPIEKRFFSVHAAQLVGNIFDPKTHAPRSIELFKSLERSCFQRLQLRELIAHRMAGDWGEDDDLPDELQEYKRCLVIRGTEFDNEFNLRIENGREKYRSIKYEKLERMRIEAGDLLIEKSGGSPDQPVGRVAILDDALLKSRVICYSNFVEKIKPDATKVLPTYLFYYLRFIHAIGVTDLLQSQTNGIRNLMVHRYLNLPVSLPSLEKQRDIVEQIQSLQNEAIVLRANAARVLEIAKQEVEKLILGS